MRLSSDAETSLLRPAGSKKPVGFRMPGSDCTSSNDDGLYIAWSDDVALEAAAAPKVEARRSLECIFLWVVCLRAVRASRAGGAGAWSRVVVCCRGGRGG